MSSIKLKHSGGNGVIIAGPSSNPASDKTITLPSDETGVFATKDSANSLQNVTGINGGQLGNRNLIINGAMQVAQRGTSSTSSSYQTVDRFKHSGSGWDAALTQAQGDVASGTTPYTQGFRKTFKLTNGNQSSGAGAGDSLSMSYVIEDQDLATSGWNYLSSSAYITLSFWFKSSVAQTFYVILESKDGTSRQYSFAITPTGADTWTKVTHTIPGNSGLQFSNDNGEGIEIYFALFYGTNLTTSSHTLNTWKTTSASDQAPDMTSTWFTTNNATFEITGVQLEVGSTATDFEHRSAGQELALCQRYFEIAEGEWYGPVYATDSTMRISVEFKVTKRADPTLASISTDENCCSSVSVVGANYDSTLGARVQGNNVFADGANKHFSAKFSASSEL